MRLLDFLKAFNKDLVIISDGAGWIIDNVSFNLSNFLNAKGISSTVARDSFLTPLLLVKNKVFYFINRWAYLDLKREAFFKKLSRNNKIIVMWWHSGAGENNQELKRSLNTLKALEKYFSIVNVPCSLEKRLLIEQGINPVKIRIIPEGIEPLFRPSNQEEKSLNRHRLGIPKGAFCIGFFQKDGIGWGEGDEPKLEKGPDIFVETISRLSKEYPDIFVVLTGPSRGYVKKRLSAAGVPFIHNYLSDYREILKYFSILDLYLITSRTEGGPKTLLEAFSCGVPVVSSRVGMCLDLIKENVNGFLCDIEDVGQFYKKTEALILDQQLRTTFSRNGLETVKDYSWDKISDVFIKDCLNGINN